MAVGRFSLTEYDKPVPLMAQISQTTGLTQSRVLAALQSAGDRVAKALSFESSLLQIADQRIRATDFAGLLRVSPSIELEVAPKFLGAASKGWREDFFFLAMLSRHGRLLSGDRLRAVSGESADLATLVARAMIQMFADHQRRPIRTYRGRIESHFAIDGVTEAEDLRLPDEDGFRQTLIRYDRTNAYNGAIAAACEDLMPEVRDADVRANLQRIRQALGRQSPLRDLRARRLPSRARAWQSTYELALDVLGGFGLTYDQGRALAPGFVLSTWQVWEDLVTIALRSSLGSGSVAAQKGLQLGHRIRNTDTGWSSGRELFVKPDLRIDGSRAGFGDLLIDAKYKGNIIHGKQRIAEADVYEAMAFAKAAQADKIVLVYPRLAVDAPRPLGSTAEFEKVLVDGLTIWGVNVEVRGIARRSGLKTFADGLLAALAKIASIPAQPSVAP
ncbi:5-methylcytosine restriction system specificity protein McrC [Brevundimonas nasdae]|jgi:hypothetical protein|uniref:5-methylcytosine restriction system specificity protein McrC n=1 Tax=Brevundimonas nasdae TaxID=172043 RepID=UPI003F693B2D